MNLPTDPEKQLTHLGPDGAARMVDISGKEVTIRTAIAKGSLQMEKTAADAIRGGGIRKGDVLQVARVAAIQAAKQTSSLIPLCHVVPLEKVDVQFAWLTPLQLECTAEVRTSAKTGVEMEALTAATIALLTVYDMVKAIDRGMRLTEIALWYKQGGVRGDYQRAEIQTAGSEEASFQRGGREQ